MEDRTQHPAYALHALVAVLDKAADQILKDSVGITYARFLLLLTLQRLESATQRELAVELGLSEPSVSRAMRGLSDGGYLTVTSTAGTGNRRCIELTAVGEKLVNESADVLEEAFGQLMQLADIEPAQILGVTGPLLKALDVESGGDPS